MGGTLLSKKKKKALLNTFCEAISWLVFASFGLIGIDESYLHKLCGRLPPLPYARRVERLLASLFTANPKLVVVVRRAASKCS